MCFDLLSMIEEMKEKNDSIGMLKVSYNETKIQKFSINEKK